MTAADLRRVATAVAALAAVALVTSGPATAAAPDWSWPLVSSSGVAAPVVRSFAPPPLPWLPGHRGVDLRGSPGDPVRAAAAGRVAFAGWVGGLPVVSVDHVEGLRTTYQPVLPAVRRGEPVAAGGVLGRLSAAGSHCPPAACLHWGLRRGATYLDPLSMVGGRLQVRLLPLRAPPAPAPVDPVLVERVPVDALTLGTANRVAAWDGQPW